MKTQRPRVTTINMERIFVLIFLCSFVFIITNAYDVIDCGSKFGKFVALAISTCKSTDPVCYVRRGRDVTMYLDFIPNKVESEIKAVVHGKYDGREYIWPLSQPDACKNSGLVCPVQPGSLYRYTVSFPVLRSYPPIHVDVTWELQEQKSSDDIICVQFPIQVV